jgi:hypothetical protein
MNAELERAAAQLAWVEAMQQVQYTLHRAVRALDYGPHADWVDCFTTDAIHAGAADSRPASPFLRHWVMAPDIEVRGDTARVTSVMGAFDSNAEAGPHVSMMGRYVDEFARCPDGRWRISRRETQVLAKPP